MLNIYRLELCCRRYEKANQGLDSYQADIANYNSMAEEIMLEAPSESIRFLSLDCNPLKEVCPALIKSNTAACSDVYPAYALTTSSTHYLLFLLRAKLVSCLLFHGKILQFHAQNALKKSGMPLVIT